MKFLKTQCINNSIVKRLNVSIILYGKFIAQLWSITCRMVSHSVICHPTQVNTPHLNPSQGGWYSIYLPRRDGRLSWPWCCLYQDGMCFVVSEYVWHLFSKLLIYLLAYLLTYFKKSTIVWPHRCQFCHFCSLWINCFTCIVFLYIPLSAFSKNNCEMISVNFFLWNV